MPPYNTAPLFHVPSDRAPSLTESNQNKTRICVIGAGPAGLTATKNLKQAGFLVDCIEQQDDVGGNWYFGSPHSSVHETTSLISSKRLTEFCGFQMPREYPQYPSHQQALDYLRSYAGHFGLYENIRFNHSVESVTSVDSKSDQRPKWKVRTTPSDSGTVGSDSNEAIYDGVVVANGHHWKPSWPSLVGKFSGEMIHSREYTSPEMLRGRRVLIVGAGNSGCDLAVEAAHYADSAVISMRRGYHFLPKYLFGAPLDRCGETMHRWRIRGSLLNWVTRMSLRVAVGSLDRAGLPKPDHRLFESHPIVNSRILDCIRHDQLKVATDVRELSGNEVVFADQTRDEFDLIICATGFEISFPFLADALNPGSRSASQNGEGLGLALNMFDARHPGLWYIGLIQPTGGIWQLADYQSQLLAHFLTAEQDGLPAAEWFKSELIAGVRRSSSTRKYVDSPRHALEVEYFEYRDRLIRLLREFKSRKVVVHPSQPVAAESKVEAESLSV